MAEVKITVNSRVYRLVCEDGEAASARFDEISEYVSTTVDQIVDEFGQIGHDRLLLMACLRLADELFDAQSPAAGGTEKPAAASNTPAKVPASERSASGGAAPTQATRREA